MYYFSTPRELPTKMDIVGDSAWNGMIKIRVRYVEASLVYLTMSIKGIPGAVQS